ncbi:hypothetical protein KCU77_g577, partial [Aureobasidium melanogenum]
MGKVTEIYKTSAGPVKLDYERNNQEGRDSKELFNDYGFVVRAKAKTGEDIHLWMFIYKLKGPEAVIDADLTQTLMVYGKFTDEEKQHMTDRPFVNKGQNIDDYYKPGTCSIEESTDHVQWSNAGRVFTCKMPEWHAGGEHAGVKVDLTFKQRSDAFFHAGRFEDLRQDGGVAGYIFHGRVNGTIQVHGKTLEIEEGHAIHERIFMGGHVPRRMDYMMKRGENWVHGFGEEFSWYGLTADVGPASTFMVNIDGGLAVVKGADKAWVEEVDRWLDPKTNQLNPRKWKIWAITDKGRLDAIVTGYSRAYYTWTRMGGSLVVHQYLCDAEATFTRTDGSVVHSKQVASLEYMRTFYRED